MWYANKILCFFYKIGYYGYVNLEGLTQRKELFFALFDILLIVPRVTE